MGFSTQRGVYKKPYHYKSRIIIRKENIREREWIKNTINPKHKFRERYIKHGYIYKQQPYSNLSYLIESYPNLLSCNMVID